MKISVILMGLSLAGLAAMIFQALRQEFTLRNLKIHMVETKVDVKRKEESIIEVKDTINGLKTKLSTAKIGLDQLRTKKSENEKVAADFAKSLETCNTGKAEVEKKRAQWAEVIMNLKASHQEAKTKAEEEVQSLKQQILDRDKAICVFADTTKEEARKLCGIAEAPK